MGEFLAVFTRSDPIFTVRDEGLEPDPMRDTDVTDSSSSIVMSVFNNKYFSYARDSVVECDSQISDAGELKEGGEVVEEKFVFWSEKVYEVFSQVNNQ